MTKYNHLVQYMFGWKVYDRNKAIYTYLIDRSTFKIDVLLQLDLKTQITMKNEL